MGRCTYSNGCIDLYLFLWLGFSCLSQQKSNDYGETDTRSLRNTSRVLAMDELVVFANFFSFPFFFFLSFIAKKLSKLAMLAELLNCLLSRDLCSHNHNNAHAHHGAMGNIMGGAQYIDLAIAKRRVRSIAGNDIHQLLLGQQAN